VPQRDVNRPLRLNINNYYHAQTGKIIGHCLSGKVEGGVLQKDNTYVIMPHGVVCQAKEILKEGTKIKYAQVGENIDASIKLKNEYDSQSIENGNVLCPIE